jgi:hypothetical protein
VQEGPTQPQQKQLHTKIKETDAEGVELGVVVVLIDKEAPEGEIEGVSLIVPVRDGVARFEPVKLTVGV